MPKQKPLTIDQIRSEMEYYTQSKPELKDLFDFYFQLFVIEHRYLDKITVSIPELADESIVRHIKDGRPLMDTGKISMNASDFKEMLTEIANLILATNQSFQEAIDELVIHPDLEVRHDSTLPIFIQNALEFRTQYFTHTAKLIPIGNELMFFIVYHTTNPFIEKASYAYRDRIDYEKWQQPVCPVCGRKQSMAMLTGDDGTRILQCSTCRSWWSYPRKQCAICMTKDEDKLEYFYSTDDEAHLVYVCNNCKKYIKTTDQRKLDREIDLDIEDLATIDLDFIAKDRGYEPGGRVTFAIGDET